MIQQVANLAAFVALTLVSVNASPALDRRIAQDTPAATKPWENACNSAGGGSKPCNELSVAGMATLLLGAKVCDQQDAADNFITFAKTLNSDTGDMNKHAQIFAQQPRNSPNLVAIQYCDKAPKNIELEGLFHCQFKGVDQTTFVNGTKVGGTGTIPFGQKTPVSPAGSCPANPGGPIDDGLQLFDVIANAPGGSGAPPPETSSSAGSGASPATTSTSAVNTSSPAAATSAGSTSSPAVRVADETVPTATQSTPTGASPAATSSTGDFQLANAQAAQKLNAQFSKLTPNSSCTDGEDACIDGDFAQCVSGSFVSNPCPPSEKCYAIPLINKSGTTITCDTHDDAVQRFANTGATGGTDGSS